MVPQNNQSIWKIKDKLELQITYLKVIERRNVKDERILMRYPKLKDEEFSQFKLRNWKSNFKKLILDNNNYNYNYFNIEARDLKFKLTIEILNTDKTLRMQRSVDIPAYFVSEMKLKHLIKFDIPICDIPFCSSFSFTLQYYENSGYLFYFFYFIF